MPIRIVHGNGDLIGAAASGIGQGVENYQEGQRAQAEQARIEQVTATLEEQLRMDQETHAQGVAEFNKRMFSQEAMQNWQRSASQAEGPNRYAEQRDLLSKAEGLTPAQRMQGLQLIDMEEMAEAREQSAMGYRGRIGEVVRRNQDLMEMSPVMQGLMDPEVLAQTAPEELPGVLESVEQEVRLLRQQVRDDEAALQMGQRLQTLSNDPALGFGMQEQIPRIIEGMADRYPPQAMNNLLAGLNGEVPMSRLMDGGATEAATREYLLQRQREDHARSEQARADAANMALGQRGPGPESFAEAVNQARAKTREDRFARLTETAGQGDVDREDVKFVRAEAAKKLEALNEQVRQWEGRVPPNWKPKEQRADAYRTLRAYWDEIAAEPNAEDLLDVKVEALGLLADDGFKEALKVILTLPEDEFEKRMDAASEGADPREKLKRLAKFEMAKRGAGY